MFFVVVGATGPTGVLVTKRALEQGHRVLALARTPSKFTVTPEPNLSVARADISEPASLDAAMQQAARSAAPGEEVVVVSCLGAHGTSPWKRTTIYSEGARCLVAAMRAHELRRLICITSWGTQPGPESPWYLTYVITPLVASGFMPDMRASEVYLESEAWPALEWTVIRPPGLADGPKTGKTVVAEGKDLVPGGKWTIPRADLADFLVDTAEKRLYLRRSVAVTRG